MSKALIFGAGGQDGFYLSECCKLRAIEVLCCSSSTGPWVHADVASYDEVETLIRNYHPDYIFHLAAKSTTRHDALFVNHAAIATGTLNILEATRLHAPEARVFLTGSGVQFRNRGEPISENDEFHASSPYAIARIHSVYAGRYYRSLGMRVYVGYLFHHESPLRKPTHVSRMISDFVRRIASGSREIIELGDIGVEKEWTFAGDVAEGMLVLISQTAVFEAAIGSGITHSIQDWLDECFEVAGLDWQDHVRIKSGFLPEYNRLVSNPGTMLGLGWQPRITFQELAAMMVQADRPVNERTLEQ